MMLIIEVHLFSDLLITEFKEQAFFLLKLKDQTNINP